MTSKAPVLLAIDAGTGSCRAVLFSLDGREVAAAAREYVHADVPDVAGSQVFDTDRNWQLVGECIRECLAVSDTAADQVRAVSATSMREGMVLYDKQGRELWACPNADARAGAEASRLMESGAAEEIYALAGDWVALTAPARFLWIRENQPDLFKQITRIGMLGDWITYRLSGEQVTDPSLGSSSAMFELATGCWSTRILEICDLSPDVCPPVRRPGTVAGEVTAAAAADTGLVAGTPVVVGGADTQLGLVGIGVSEPNRFTLIGGSFWQLTSVWDRPLIDPERRLRTLCHTIPGQWMMEGIGFYSGLALRWFRDAFCAGEPNAYSMLEREAANVSPGANGIFGIFSNVMNAKHWVHASPGFVGFDIARPRESGRKECFRALQESAVYAAYAHLKIAEQISDVTATEMVFTGGAANSRSWCQIVADMFEMPALVPQVKESTALGAAMYAGIGAGLFADLADAMQIVRFEDEVEPTNGNHQIYLELYERWRQTYLRALELADVAGPRPLWRAPGT